ncbi:hypothetical protein [uncultured Phascolarctobacterium sp.]|uniref:hypothetical protein n=1 Tax=uncultured Phascolarctobacterium sp. TaxID=512296 RepID=UPI0025FED681|nr:hypothetical protein [uncultured Phascolarctobacterium sp.]
MEAKQNIQQKTGVYAYLQRKRNAAAQVFPHRGQDAADFIKRIQGAKLSDSSVRALKRG